jgi:imidazolonepropionase-like amidohydrolase
MRTVLYPEWIVDGTGALPLSNHAVVIAGHSIEILASRDSIALEEGDQELALPGTTLLPGLINSHVHLVLPGDGRPFSAVQHESDVALGLRAAHNIGESLKAGVTTVRDCGGRGTIVLEVREAVRNGMLPGARVIACGWPVTITGGHERYFGGEADGAVELRRMVRRQVSAGADFVKVLASGGGTPGSLSHYPSFSLEELRVIVDTAHSLGLPVGLHCIATEAISNAIQAGADVIEHALFMEADGRLHLNERVAEELAESGIPVTTTMQVARDIQDLRPGDVDLDRWRYMFEADCEIKARLRALGVTLLPGSDAGWRVTPFDTFWKELDELVKIGMSPVEAIHAATGRAARVLGIADQVGTIQAGKLADLVVVAGEVSRDIRCLQNVQTVLQSGTRVH